MKTPLLLTLAALILGCSRNHKSDVLRGVANAKAAFEMAQTNPNKQAELDVLGSMNAPLSGYVLKHLPPGESFKNYQNDCSVAWCVAIKPVGPLKYTIAGYGDDLAHPIATETVDANNKPAGS